MITLLLKDLFIIKEYLIAGALLIWVLFIGLGALEGIPLAIPTMLLSHFVIVIASKIDAKNQSDLLLNSLPVTRQQIVTAKYFGVVAFSLLCFVLTTGMWGISSLILDDALLPAVEVRASLLAVTALILFYSIYFPLYFKYGASLSTFLDGIVIVGIAIVVLVGLQVVRFVSTSYPNLVDVLAAGSSANAVGIGLATVTLLVVGSHALSRRWYASRDL